jgi:hypothetical protein
MGTLFFSTLWLSFTTTVYPKRRCSLAQNLSGRRTKKLNQENGNTSYIAN